MRLSKHSLRSLCFWFTVTLAIAPAWDLAAVAQSSSSGRAAAQRNLDASATANKAVPADVSAVLVDLASRAAVIFTGQVLAITPSAGVVDIRFQIDTPIRNCPQNGNYVVREWAGLWTAHPNRYRVGQRVLLFLAARGVAGMSAPVDVNDGIVPLIATAQQPIMDASGTVPADSPSDGLTVDLRWLQARVTRSSTTPVLLNSLSAGNSAAKAWSGPVTPLEMFSAPRLTSVIAVIGKGGNDPQF